MQSMDSRTAHLLWSVLDTIFSLANLYQIWTLDHGDIPGMGSPIASTFTVTQTFVPAGCRVI
jgi:hypothetical protein